MPVLSLSDVVWRPVDEWQQGNIAPLIRSSWYRGAHQGTRITSMSQPNAHRDHRRYFAASLQVNLRYAVPTSGMLSVFGVHRAGGGPSPQSVSLVWVLHAPSGEYHTTKS